MRAKSAADTVLARQKPKPPQSALSRKPRKKISSTSTAGENTVSSNVAAPAFVTPAPKSPFGRRYQPTKSVPKSGRTHSAFLSGALSRRNVVARVFSTNLK